MQLVYPSKKEAKKILDFVPSLQFSHPFSFGNTLIHGENLDALSILLHKYNMCGKVDLIYIDPPFATNGIFTIGKEHTATVSASMKDAVAYEDTLVGEAFLEFLRERLIIASHLLSDQGSIYLHIDYKIGHYVKIVMDEIFGVKNFRNDITRIKCNPKNFSRKAYGNIKDSILFYSKTTTPIWNEAFVPYSSKDIEKLYKKIDATGEAYTTVPLHAPGETKDGLTGLEFKGVKPPKGRHWRTSPLELEKLDVAGLIEWSANGVPRRKIFLKDREQKGKKMQDIWEFKDSQSPTYPTEKNLDLLKSIIATSSNENSIVLDFFCGSGTALLAAQQLNRKWIGIDKSEHAIETVKKRFAELQCPLFSDNRFDFITMIEK